MALQAQVLAHFAQQNIHLSPAFISTLIASIHLPPVRSTPALLTSLHASLLASSLHQSAAPQSYLPASIPTQHNVSIPGPALVQVVHVQDIGTSRLAQLEALEKAITEAGPQGRRVVDLPADEEGEDPATENGVEGLCVGKSVCKVLLEDGRGERVYGMEMKSIEGVRVGMSLGCKLLLMNVPVLRGVLQLRPTNTTVLGGRVAALDDGYFPTRWKQEMEAAVEELKGQQNGNRQG